MVDLLGLYRIWSPNYNRFSGWCQDRLATVLLGWPVEENYNAASDALKSIRLFHLYFRIQDEPGEWNRAFRLLMTVPVLPIFPNPAYNGVCMGDRKYCICGGTFFS